MSIWIVKTQETGTWTSGANVENGGNGKCIIGSQKCWFRRDYSEIALKSDKTTTENNKVIEKVFGMLEKMTERIIQIEKCNMYYE